MFKICVIGCGGMSTRGHGPSFQKYKKSYPEISLAACCDLVKERAEKYRETFGFETCYTDYIKMLHEIRPDVVSLISPVNYTCEIAVNVMKMGFPLIMEKPPGKNIAEIETLRRQAEQSGVSVRTAFNRRYTPLILELKKKIRDINEPIFNITYFMYRCNRRDEDFSTTAIHAVDVVRDIVASDYERIGFTYQELPQIGKNVKNIYMDCKFENGAVGQIALVPMGGAVSERISINMLNHTVYVELPFWKNVDSPGKLVHLTGDKVAEFIDGSALADSDAMFEESGFYEENRSFFEHLRNHGETICDLESAVQSVEIEDCIRNSIPIYEKKSNSQQ